jgi:hypothetical protein
MSPRLRRSRSRFARRTLTSSLDRSGSRLSGGGTSATGIAGPDSSRRSSRTSASCGTRGVAQRTHGRWTACAPGLASTSSPAIVS